MSQGQGAGRGWLGSRVIGNAFHRMPLPLTGLGAAGGTAMQSLAARDTWRSSAVSLRTARERGSSFWKKWALLPLLLSVSCLNSVMLRRQGEALHAHCSSQAG